MPVSVVIVGSSTPVQKALPHFDESTIEVKAIFCDLQSDKAIARYAEKASIPLFDMLDLKKSNGIKACADLQPDYIFNINSMILFRDELLSVPKIGSLNLHCGILPQQAGKHAHQWAIRENQKEFGVTLHWIEKGIDTGAIAYIKKFPITEKDTGLSLYLKYVNEGALLIEIVLKQIDSKNEIPKIQQDLTKRVYHFDNEAQDGKIHWNWDAEKIKNFVRAADYGPFQSPTYQPYTLVEGKKVVVKKGNVTNKKSNDPGRIEFVDDNKFVVGTASENFEVTSYKSNSDLLLKPGMLCN